MTVSDDSERKSVSVAMPDEMVKQIEERLEYGDSRAEWIRTAIREKLDRDGQLTATPE